MQLHSLSDMIDQIRRDTDEEKERAVKNIERRREEYVRMAETTRMALPELLELEGDNVSVSGWPTGTRAEVFLGERPHLKKDAKGRAEFARRLVALRKALGPLKSQGEDVSDPKQKLAQVTLKADSFPGITVRYLAKVKKGKCKIVKHTSTYYSLVCGE